MDNFYDMIDTIESVLQKNRSILSVKTISKRANLNRRKVKKILKILYVRDAVRNVPFHEIGRGKAILGKYSYLWQII